MPFLRLLCVFVAVFLASCGGGGAGSPSGGGNTNTNSAPASTALATGQVVDDQGAPLAGAVVTVLLAGGTSPGLTGTPVTTDNQGAFSLTLGTASPALLRIDKPGYMRMLRAAPAAGQNNSFAARIDMQAVAVAVTFDATQAAVLRVPGSAARVELPAAALVRVDGAAISGQARVELTPIDPSQNISLMPGLLVDASSGAPIESLGAMAINFSDATGAPLNLASGQSAALRIPATPAAGATLPPTYPLYHLNETTGLWVQEGTAILKTDVSTGAQYYEGTVTHFSFWNVDQPLVTSFIDLSQSDIGVCSYIADVSVRQTGVNYNGYGSVIPAVDLRLPVRGASVAKLTLLSSGEILDTLEVTTPANGATGRLPRCLAVPARVTVSGQVSVASGSLAGYFVQLSGAGLFARTVAIAANGSYSAQIYAQRGLISARLVGADNRRDLPTTAVTATVGRTNVLMPPLTVNDARVELSGCVAGWASYRQDRVQLALSKGGVALAAPVTLNATSNTFRFLVPVNVDVQLLLTPPDPSLLERRVTFATGNTPSALPDCLVLPKGPLPALTATGTGLTRQFDASASAAGDAAISTYQWRFGDGTSATGAVVNHPFAAPGDYLVALELTDTLGQTAVQRRLISISAPNNLNTLTPASSFDAGDGHACSIRSGSPWCWGSNFQQQLGRLLVQTIDGDTITNTGLAGSTVAIPVDASITNATAISAGEDTSCVLLAAGEVRCWGGRDRGGLGNGSASGSAVPVAVTGITTAKAVAVGGFHSCALLADGSVRCWGGGTSGQLGNGVFANSAIPVQVTGITNATALSAGRSHTCALLADGTLRCWGSGRNGKLGQGTTVDTATPVNVIGITGAFAVTAGTDHSCAAVGTGQIQCWGARGFAPGALLGDGLQAGGDQLTPVTVSGITTAVSVSAGSAHTCALLADGTVRCWGSGSSGELGALLASPFKAFVPQQASLLGTTAAFSAGSGFNCTVSTQGELQCFGDNSFGKLGAGQGEIVISGSGGSFGFNGLGQSAAPLTVLFP